MVGKHSKEAELRRRIRAIIKDAAFNDKILDETVNVLSSQQLLLLVPEPVPFHLVEIERGEVLTDSRGTGSWQRIPPLSNKMRH